MRRATAGFTLVELLIALAISLVITGAAVTLAVNISRSATETTVYTRTTQDLRTVMNVMTREIRRAGFNMAALDRIGTGTSAPFYGRLLSNAVAGIGSCVMFGYDTLDVGNGTSDSTPGVISDAEPTEWRGFRRFVNGNGVGVLQIRAGGTGAGEGCDNGGHNWVNLTDPATLDVTMLQLDFTRIVEAVAGTVGDPTDPTETMIALVGVRPILVTLRARSPADPDNVRELRQWVRVRADALRLVDEPAPPPPPPGP